MNSTRPGQSQSAQSGMQCQPPAPDHRQTGEIHTKQLDKVVGSREGGCEQVRHTLQSNDQCSCSHQAKSRTASRSLWTAVSTQKTNRRDRALLMGGACGKPDCCASREADPSPGQWQSCGCVRRAGREPSHPAQAPLRQQLCRLHVISLGHRGV